MLTIDTSEQTCTYSIFHNKLVCKLLVAACLTDKVWLHGQVAPTKSHKEQARDEVEANKKKGRPKKIIDKQEAEVEKARRGRPPKASLALQYDDEKRKAKKKKTKKH